MSSTRGFFIGQIVDELGSIAYQVDTRSKLGYTDLNTMLENFFRDVLDIIFDLKLTNLNEKRSNEPSLDLGDSSARVAYQVTSSATSQKVNETLLKLTDEQKNTFENIHILVVGKKQKTYTLKEEATNNVNFELSNIRDINDLCRDAVALPMLKLQDLHRLVMAEVVRVRVELEVPNSVGEYPTAFKDFVEPIGQVESSDGSLFANAEDTQTLYGSKDKAVADLNALADALSKLPRFSREFYVWMLSRRETESNFRINADLVDRASRYPDTKGELRFLADRGFLRWDEPDAQDQSAYWRLLFPDTTANFEDAFITFVCEQKINLEHVIERLDFSAFGESTE